MNNNIFQRDIFSNPNPIFQDFEIGKNQIFKLLRKNYYSIFNENKLEIKVCKELGINSTNYKIEKINKEKYALKKY